MYLLSSDHKVTNATLSNLVGGIKDGDEVISAKITGERQIEVLVSRDGNPMTFKLAARIYKAGDYRLTANPFATVEEKKRLEEWLKIP